MGEVGRPNPAVAAGIVLLFGFKVVYVFFFLIYPLLYLKEAKVSLSFLWPFSPSLMWPRTFGV